MKHYYVYILTNYTNKVLYVGVTNDILRRSREHKCKMLEGFTKKYNLYKLVYVESFSDIKEAIAAEKKLKGWTRKKKIALIESKNPTWKDLFPIIQEYSVSLGVKKDSSLRSPLARLRSE